VRDVRAALAALDAAGDEPLDGAALAALGSTLAAAAQLAASAQSAGGSLASLAPALGAPPAALAAAVARSLSFPGGAVLDAASPVLAACRAERRDVGRELRALLTATAQRLLAERACEAAQVVSRRQRLCVPVRAGMTGLLPGGVVLDASASGATLFVEPAPAVALNNAAAALEAKEAAEQDAVLRALTAQARDAKHLIRDCADALTQLDLALARGRHGDWVGGAAPRFTRPADASTSPADMRGARHPLLLAPSLPPPPLRWWEEEAAAAAAAAAALALPPQRKGATAAADAPEQVAARAPPPVPVDWMVPPGCRCVVVSGPNTGGKTAGMKTLALACLLARAGGRPPATSASLPWPRRVLCDLGDAQSLDAGLSTFSGHVARLTRIVKEVAPPQGDTTAAACDPDGASLVLLDEPGGGTDPVEGAALACALLTRMAAPGCGALAVATTHYEEVKALAGDDTRFANAAVEFDAARLAPTYRLLWGAPGASYALDVATALGLPPSLLAAARAAEAAAGRRGAGGAPPPRDGAVAARLRTQLAEAEAAAATAAAQRAEAEAEAEALRARAAALLPGEEALLSTAQKKAEQARAAARAALSAAATAAAAEDGDAEAVAVAAAAHMPAGWSLAPGAAGVAGAVRREGAPAVRAWTPRPGDQVRVVRLGARPATVVSVTHCDAEVRLGMLVSRVPIAEVLPLLPDSAAAVTPGGPKRAMPTPRISRAEARVAEARAAVPSAAAADDASALVALPSAENTLDLRGMYAADAVAELESAVNARGRRAGASALFVVHGMGTGRVKAAVLDALKAHPLVMKVEQAPQRHGGLGCTIAYIR
jgi:DNA mismatch repair protein MutS2